MSSVLTWLEGVELSTAVSLASLESMTPAAWRRVIASGLSPRELINQPAKAAGCLTKNQLAELSQQVSVDKQLKLMAKHQIGLLTLSDPSYPALLSQINDPPLWLFWRGSLEALARPTLTIVGTREPTTYATTALRHVIDDSLIDRVTLVSGLAFGVDKEVHTLSLERHMPTVAVLAGGLDQFTPQAHDRLGVRILEEGGLILSEYPPLSPPQAWRFPVRNRILAGLSRSTIIVEANLKSGTMTTVRSAIDYNRDVWAIPADITRTKANAGNYLIKEGALLLDDPTQLLDYYGLTKQDSLSALDGEQAQFVELLADGPKSIELLSKELEMELGQLSSELSLLELSGLIRQLPNGQYILAKD